MPVTASSYGLPHRMHKARQVDVTLDASVDHRALRASWPPLLLASAAPDSCPGHVLAGAAVDAAQAGDAPHQMAAPQLRPVAQSSWFMRKSRAVSTTHTCHIGILSVYAEFDGYVTGSTSMMHILWDEQH